MRVLLVATIIARAVEAAHDGGKTLDPRVACGVKAYQFINYREIYGTGGNLCYRVECA